MHDPYNMFLAGMVVGAIVAIATCPFIYRKP